MRVKKKRLKKQLNLLSVYCIATGATLSSGFFLLPGIASEVAGPAVIISYLISALPLIPAMFSVVELSTAMPRTGGTYFFLDRSMGPLFGTIGGIGSWFALILKTSFGLIGIGAYLSLFFPDPHLKLIAVIFAILFAILNCFGSAITGQLQIFLVISLLSIIAFFGVSGIPHIELLNFHPFFGEGWEAIISTSGMVYVSYVGITKIATMAEEVKNPERNLPLGIFLALGTVISLYILGITVMVGVIPKSELYGNYAPFALVGDILFGKWGKICVTIAAFLAFASVVNAGILSASKYLVAMSRDQLLPSIFSKLLKNGSSIQSIVCTAGIMILIVLFLNPVKIAKLASAFQLLMFALISISVIVMRESGLESYDPSVKSPFYPWMQILGIFLPLYFIVYMGWISILFSILIILAGSLWYFYYARNKVARDGAIYHMFEQLGKKRYVGLDRELRDILKEKGLREEDPFDQILAESYFIEAKEEDNFETIVKKVSSYFSNRISISIEELSIRFLDGTKIGATPVSHGAALPHIRVKKRMKPQLVLVRSKQGIKIEGLSCLIQNKPIKPVIYAFFFLVSSEENPGQHLRVLAQIAEKVDEDRFIQQWNNAKNIIQIKEIFLHKHRFFSIELKRKSSTEKFIGKTLAEIHFPKEVLIAFIRRGNHALIPHGNTLLFENDHLTIIGEPEEIEKMRNFYRDAL